MNATERTALRLNLPAPVCEKLARLTALHKVPLTQTVERLLTSALEQEAPGELPKPEPLQLDQVTLLLFNGNDPELGARVLRFLAHHFRFARMVHLTYQRPKSESPGDYFQIPRFDYRQAMRFQSRCLGPYVQTPYVIQIEPDGFPVNPHLWTDDFLEWDYIGAPWPPNLAPAEYRVGNGGCSLRSKKFLDAIESAPDHFEENGDCYMCQRPDVRQHLEKQGIRFAPLDVAMRFAMENVIPEFPGWTEDQSFGFHGMVGERARVLDGF